MVLSSKGMSMGWRWGVALIPHLVGSTHGKTPVFTFHNVPLPVLGSIVQHELAAFGTKQKVIVMRYLTRFLIFGVMNPRGMIHRTHDDFALDGIRIGARIPRQYPIADGNVGGGTAHRIDRFPDHLPDIWTA